MRGGFHANRGGCDGDDDRGAQGRLTEELGAVFAGRTRKVLFVKGAESLTYGEVVGAVDASRAAGVQVVGLVPRS